MTAHHCTDRPKPICPLNFFRSWGHKNRHSSEIKFGPQILWLTASYEICYFPLFLQQKSESTNFVIENLFVCLFVVRFNVPISNFSVTSGQSHSFLGFNQYSGKLRTQHGAASEDQTQELLITTLPLRHHATHRKYKILKIFASFPF